MEIRADLPVSMPGLRAVRWTSDKLYEGLKDYFALGRIERGRSSFWGSGKAWESEPGCVQIKQPGDVHRDIAREGPTTWVVVVLSSDDIARVRDDGRASLPGQLYAGDQQATAFHRLFDAIDANTDRLALEVALAEAVSSFARLRARPDYTRPVRRAMEYLHASWMETITLDDLARQADLDKFHLCRAFRAQIGMPPHAYLTHLRITHAKQLLRRGVRLQVAPRVGLYDQAQLTRHFRRIVGTTPARYPQERRAER